MYHKLITELWRDYLDEDKRQLKIQENELKTNKVTNSPPF